MDFSISGDTAVLIGGAAFFAVAFGVALLRRHARRNRRPSPAYPSSPHSTQMWIKQPVSAPATIGQVSAKRTAAEPEQELGEAVVG